MAYLSLPAESWETVADRVAAAEGPLCWAWAGIRDGGGAPRVALLRVSSDQARPTTLDYGVLVIHIESVEPPAPSRRLMSGGISGSQGSAQRALEIPPSTLYPPPRATG